MRRQQLRTSATATCARASPSDSRRSPRADAHPRAVGEEIARIVDLPAGQRPFRSVVDPADDGAAAVTDIAERVRWDFARRIGIEDLLPAASGVEQPSIATS